MRFLAGIIALIIVVGLAGTLVGRSTAPISDVRAAEQAEADAGLDRIVSDVNLDQTPLDQAIKGLSEQTGTNIAVNWHALEAVGIKPTQPVTLRLRNLPLGTVLEILARVLVFGWGGGTEILDSETHDGVIHFSTVEDLGSHDIVVRLYDVKDLVRWDEKAPPPSTRPAALFNGYVTVQRGPLPASYDDAIGQLMSIITEHVAPDTWREAGGVMGSIRDFNGSLLISQTKRNHIAIEKLLAILRSGPVKPKSPPAK